MFQLADIHKKGELTVDEVIDLMKKINGSLSSHQIQRLLRVGFHFSKIFFVTVGQYIIIRCTLTSISTL